MKFKRRREIMNRDESHITLRMLSIKVHANRSRGRLKKMWLNCVGNDMCIEGVNIDMSADTREWNRKTCYADST